MELFFLSVFALLIILGIMVLVHEFGHFAAAKFFGVRVEQFAVGFGKRLWGFRRGDTDYRINLLPLGGYVKMSGENPGDARAGDPGEFTAHPRWQRFFIAVAGPAMNILLAIALLTGVFMYRYPHAAYLEGAAVVGSVEPNSPAAAAGLQPDDKIIRIGDKPNPNWMELGNEIMLSPGQPLNLEVQRGTEVLVKKLVPQSSGKDEIGTAGVEPFVQSAVYGIEPGMPASKAGVHSGDEVLAINGAPLHSPDELIPTVQKTQGAPAVFTLGRNGQQFNVTMKPVLTTNTGSSLYRVGMSVSAKAEYLKLSLPAAFSKSVARNREDSALILELVRKLLQRKVSIKQLASPIGIGRAAGQAAMQPNWLLNELLLMQMISLQLGILNLFPIPILDGGMILFLLIEGILRRDISLQVKERIYQAAFVALLLFFVVVIYNDIVKLVPGA